MLSDRELEQTYAKIKIKEKPFRTELDRAGGTDSDPPPGTDTETDRWDGLGSVGEPHGVSVTAVQSDDLTAADIAQVRVGTDSDPPERQTVVS